MKIIIIGLGSMGKRRTRLLSEMKGIQLFGIDSQESRCAEVKEKFGIQCYSSISEAVETEHPDAAVISTSPLSHAAIINECLHYNLHVFTEINLVSDGYDENMKMAENKGLVLFLSSTFLYRKETQTLIKKVKDFRARINYIYHVGQYLPDWHPWENYNNYFIGDSRTNGCREIMAIDMPWMITAFGEIDNVKAIKSKNTDLNISYNDNYLIIIEHKTGAKGIFAVDVVSRKPYRHLDVYGENIQLSWNGTADSVMEYDFETKEMVQVPIDEQSEHVEGYAKFITENQYRAELQAFLAQIENPSILPKWDFKRDKELLQIIDQIEA